MDTKKLRQKILDLAIRGKLVPQDPNDEPASVLLERIRAEKERLIAEGKIKRSKRSKTSSTESHYQKFTPPFEIPDSWEWVRLEDIGDIVTGSTPSKSDTSNYGYEYPFYKPNDLEQGFYTTKSHDNLSTKGMAAARELPIGSVLVTCIGATIGKTGLIRTKGASNQQINAIIPNMAVVSEYLYYIIIGEYFQNSIKQKASSTTLPILNKGDFSKLHIPIPPKNEQKRIFSLIIRLFNIVSDIENAASNINESVRIAKSKILDLAMQGKLVPQDPADEPAADMLLRVNPKAKIITDNQHSWKMPLGWCITDLKSIGKWQSGATPGKMNPNYYGKGVPWLNTGDLTDGEIYKIPKEITVLALKETSVKLNPSGSVLIAMYGATIGKLGILTFEATTNQACCACAKCFIFNKFLFYFLKHHRPTFIKIGGGGAQPNISKEKIENTVLYLPPLNEQKRIVARIEQLYSVLNEIEASLQS